MKLPVAWIENPDAYTILFNSNRAAYSFINLELTDTRVYAAAIEISTASESIKLGLRGNVISDNVSVAGGRWQATLWQEPRPRGTTGVWVEPRKPGFLEPRDRVKPPHYGYASLEWLNPPARYRLDSKVALEGSPEYDLLAPELAIRNALWAASVVRVTSPQ